MLSPHTIRKNGWEQPSNCCYPDITPKTVTICTEFAWTFGKNTYLQIVGSGIPGSAPLLKPEVKHTLHTYIYKYVCVGSYIVKSLPNSISLLIRELRLIKLCPNLNKNCRFLLEGRENKHKCTALYIFLKILTCIFNWLKIWWQFAIWDEMPKTYILTNTRTRKYCSESSLARQDQQRHP